MRELLRHHDTIQVVGMASDQDKAIGRISEHTPHVVLLDLPKQKGIPAAKRIAAQYPDVKVIAMAVPEVEADVLAWAEAGAVGYTPKEASLEDLVSTIEAVVRGELRCSPRIAATLFRRVAKLSANRRQTPQGIHLTPRELEILDLIDRGLSNKQIASNLGIEVATVKNHVHNILEKLQVSRRGEAAARMRSRLPQLLDQRRADVT